MFARATRLEWSRDRLDDAIRQFHEEALPAAESQPGFSGGMLLVDRVTGSAMAVSLWETEEDMHVSEQRVREASAARAPGEPHVECYEVVMVV